MLFPYRIKNPPETFPTATLLLIVANVAAFLGTSNSRFIAPEMAREWGFSSHHLDGLHACTAMFLHANWIHLLGNMWFLYLFGVAVEGRLKWFLFVPLYFVTGVAGFLVQWVAMTGSPVDVPSIGASGAIMGLLGAAMYIFPFSEVRVFYWILFYGGVLTWPMWGTGICYLLLESFYATSGFGGAGVAHFAHLGGIVAGFLLSFALSIRRDPKGTSTSKAILAELKDHSYLTAAELESLHATNPTDPRIIIQWAIKSARDKNSYSPRGIEVFVSALPKLIDTDDVVSLGAALRAIDDPRIAGRTLFGVAMKLERRGDCHTAFILMERASRKPDLPMGEVEACFYRMAMISETALNDLQRALGFYEILVERWPFGAFAESAKGRITVLAPRVRPPT